MTKLAVNLFDGDGRWDRSAAEIDHALSLAKGDPDASLLLFAQKAVSRAGWGDVSGARTSLSAAALSYGDAASDYAKDQYGFNEAVVLCLALEPPPAERIEEALRRAHASDDERDYMHLVTWYVPYLFAVGSRVAAHPWSRALRLAAVAGEHRWRVADAEGFTEGERVAGGKPPVLADATLAENWLSLSRLQPLRLRHALWHGDSEAIGQRLEEARAFWAEPRAANLEPIEPYEACARAYADPDEIVEVLPPNQVYLMNLGGVLAAMEAVALAGSQTHAHEWHGWVAQNLPTHIETAIEWPVSRRRVQALLALRAGHVQIAKEGMKRAVRWADEAGYAVEAGIAKVQLSEMMVRQVGKLAARDRAQLRREGSEQLRAFGIDPLPHAYVASRALASVRDDSNRPSLSPREAEVLKYLSEGHTYRETAEKIGLSWPTVQTFAHRAYEKLGVSGKQRAAEVARELGIL